MKSDANGPGDITEAPAPAFELAAGCGGLQIVGDASCGTSGVQLNADKVTGTQGGAYLDHQVSIAGGFHVAMALRFTVVNGQADGAAFMIQVDPRGPSALGGGAALGIGGVIPSVAVELDTYDDVGPGADPDPNANHVGYDIDGDTHSSPVNDTPGVFLASGTAFHVWIDYDETTRRLDTYVSATSAKPTTAVLSSLLTNVWLDSPVWMGLVGGSGPGNDEAHDVLELTIN